MMNRFLKTLTLFAALVLILVSAGCDFEDFTPEPDGKPAQTEITKTPAAQIPAVPAAGSATPAVEDILRIVNNDPMINQPKSYPQFTITESWYVTTLQTIHWNNGTGSPPGKISLQDSTGKVYGPWQTTGEEVKGVKDARWVVEPKLTLPPGAYTVLDSDPPTWSANEASKFVGFVLVIGRRGAGDPSAALPSTPGQSASLETLPLTTAATTPLKADGKALADRAGVSGSVPAGAVSDGSGLKLVASQPPADFDKFLQENGMTRKSAFYTIQVEGKGDSLPDAALSFPVTSPGDRIARLVEGPGLIWADDQLVNGKRVVQAFIGLPGDPAAQYVLLSTGKGTAIIPSDEMMAVRWLTGSHPAGPVLAGPDAIENCAVYVSRSSMGYSFTWRSWSCRRNTTYHVEVISREISDATWDHNFDKIDAFLNKTIGVVKTYAAQGFVKAKPEANRTLQFMVVSKAEAAHYNALMGYIQLGWNDLGNAASTPKMAQTLAHEIFHWVEHGTYRMRNPSPTPEFLWWSEIAAEVATFYIDPANVQLQLKNYGQSSNGGEGNKLGWQEPPFEWISGVFNQVIGKIEESRYIQAIQYYLQMSESISNGATFDCLGGKAVFVEDINRGNVPSADPQVRQNYISGSPDLAKYLLNVDPNRCRSMATGGILKSGRGYGDYIHVSGYSYKGGLDRKGFLTVGTNNVWGDDFGSAKILAMIPMGDVYPLRISNGADVPVDDNPNWKSRAMEGVDQPSVPYKLTIQSFTPFFYTTGDGESHFVINDLKEPLVISPISSAATVTVYTRDAAGNLVAQQKAGIPSVRIVAFSTVEETTFKATFEPMPAELVFTPARLTNLAQKLSQVIQVKLVNLLPVVTEPVEFKFTVLFTDGKTGEIPPAKATPKDGTAEVTVTYTFPNANVKEVLVTANYKLGPLVRPVKGVIPVDKGATTNPNPSITQTTWLRVAISSGSNDLLGKGKEDVLVPIQWTDPSNFITDPKSTTFIKVKGSVGSTGASVSIVHPDLTNGIKLTCPHAIWLSNIPGVAGYWEFSTRNFPPAITEIGAYISRFDTLILAENRCFSGNVGTVARSNSVFTLTFCKNAKCD